MVNFKALYNERINRFEKEAERQEVDGFLITDEAINCHLCNAEGIAETGGTGLGEGAGAVLLYGGGVFVATHILHRNAIRDIGIETGLFGEEDIFLWSPYPEQHKGVPNKNLNSAIVDMLVKGGLDRSELLITENEGLAKDLNGMLSETEIPRMTYDPVFANNQVSLLDADAMRFAQRAGKITAETMFVAKESIEWGKTTERELDLIIYNEFMSHDEVCGLSFPTIVATGRHTSYSHWQAKANAIIQPEDPVIIDMGVYVGGVPSDMTRTFLGPKVDQRVKDAYNLQRRALLHSMGALQRENATFHDVADGSINIIERNDAELPEMYYAKGEVVGGLMPHAFGHPVTTRAVHGTYMTRNDKGEILTIRRVGRGDHIPIPERLLIAMEPALYVQDKFGIRNEGTYVKTGKFFEETTRHEKLLLEEI